MILFICIAVGILGLLVFGSACCSVHQTHASIQDRDCHLEDKVEANLRCGMKLFMPFDIWTSH